MMKNFIVFAWILLFSFTIWASERNKMFLMQVRQFSTKKESVDYAHKQIKDENSSFRIDAVEFIREIKDVDSIPLLQEYVNDRDINTFVIYALGDLQAFEATSVLIELLNHSNPNVRGNAFAALGKIYPLHLPQGYAYKEPETRRNRQIKKIKLWWDKSGLTLQKNYQRDLHSDQQAKEALWEKYGKKYLMDSSH
ncbi:MAG: HEAT repeat domain-containing protein [Deltaproteobacteria bacterium]|nr:HEAT repeat domain-containing protein [Deltaproteobacteria bacterium]